MPKLTLAEELEARRLAAIEATDQDIANFIWKKIYDIFDSFDGFELECLELVTVTVTEETDFLALNVMIKETDSFAFLEKAEEAILVFTPEKLERIERVMEIVTDKASEEGLEAWQDVDDENRNCWGFCI